MDRWKLYKKAWDRFTEEVDISEIDSPEQLIESFFDWLNPEAGKKKGLSNFESFIIDQWNNFIEELPTYEQTWIKKISPVIPEQYKEKARSWYEKILTAKSKREAEEYFYRMPTRIWKALPLEQIKQLRETILRYFL